MSSSTLPPSFINGLKGTLTLATVLGFLALSSYAFWATFQAEVEKPTLNSAYTYVTAGISSLIGGFYAEVFASKPSDVKAEESLLFSNVKALADETTTKRSGTGAHIALSVFSITAYTLVGVASIIVWISKPDLTADPIKGTATAFIGLALPIVRGYISQPR
ncbi:hypothetical protein [Streptomyces sp. NBC_00582]|uniref:hypothetical protein n=1 Tax=Streptomyces sp. NBC_00582 TaxID=2975783 RepID=UPI002E822598|nr:hypothetical protein [Streptomyces sp. NBC_00582]WUB60920.1 hypothetical protein OG852_11245 [Streptomyces sp. NBC_00582]